MSVTLVTDPNSQQFNSCATVEEAIARLPIYYPGAASYRWDIEGDNKEDIIAQCLIRAMYTMSECFQWTGYKTYRGQIFSHPRKGSTNQNLPFDAFTVGQDIKDIQILVAYCFEYRHLKRRLDEDLSNDSPGFDLLVTGLGVSGLSVNANSPDTYSEMDQILSDPFHHITSLSRPYTSSVRGGVVTKQYQYDYTTTTSTTSTSSTTTV